MTDKAYLTLVIRDKEGKLHEREYQVHVGDEEWNNAVEYNSHWIHFWAGKWEGYPPMQWIWLPEFGIEIEQKLKVDEEGRGDWHQEIRQRSDLESDDDVKEVFSESWEFQATQTPIYEEVPSYSEESYKEGFNDGYDEGYSDAEKNKEDPFATMDKDEL